MKLRQKRMADNIRDIVGQCFSSENLNDPRVKGVTITRVKVTADLQLASIYFRMYELDLDQDTAIKGLESCKGKLRKVLAEKLIVRRVPELRFFYDDAQDNALKIEQLLYKIKNEK